ncbi:MAG: transglycosylase domain-containing protein [Bacteroidetes bacterium]|nr:transglycosylase domain-containing protein [Bacteroidota bacterium]
MKKAVRIFWYVFFGGLGIFITLLLMANFGVFGKMPTLTDLENPSILQASEVYAEDGTLMGKYYRENGNRSVVKYRDISPYIINGLIATEDKRFYTHSGIDMKGTLRAVFTGGMQGGGSTITQQLAKALLDQGRVSGLRRMIEKLKEWIVAVKLEKNFTKEEIIALYLNTVPYSDNVFGIRNASRTFFQKEPDRLTVDEAALLVGMINGPGLYNPRRNPKAAMDRRNLVISRMEENGNITSAEASKFKALPIKLNYRKLDENTGYAPYFREVLKGEVKEALKDIKKSNGDSYDIYDDGLKIYTTINLPMQQYAEEGMAQHMAMLQKGINARNDFKAGTIWKDHEKKLEKAIRESDRWKNGEEDGLSDKEIRASFEVKVPMRVFSWNAKRERDTTMTPIDSIKYHLQMEQACFMAMDPITGEVKAWVGGIHYKTYKNDHVNLKTKRQVGSTIKPFLYTQAMEERGFTPETECENVAQLFPGSGWVPSGKKCGGGSMSMANALAYSKNCATAYIMKQVGPKQFADFLSRIGIPTPVKPFPSICLGTCDLSLYEMLWGYTIFAGRGFSTKPYSISRIEDRNGNVIKRFDYSVNRKEAISEVTAYTMARMMQGTVDKGTARGMRTRVGASEMGGKTGTTDDNADAWFMGYTPQLLAGSWVGFEYTFMRNQGDGSRIARPITEYFFRKVLADKKLGIDKDAKFVKPAELENEINSADIMISDSDPNPAGEGIDQGVGDATDYDEYGSDSLGPESKDYMDENNTKPSPQPVKKDTLPKSPAKKEEPNAKPIGSLVEDPKKKKNN